MKTFGIGYIVTALMVYVSSINPKEFSCEHNATKYSCTLPFEKLNNSQMHILYHVYSYEPFIAARIHTSPTNTKLIMKLESFDNNTSVDVKLKNKSDVWSNKIVLTAKYVVKHNIVAILKYYESTDIHFSCEEYASRAQLDEVFTVLINNKKNKIKVLSENLKSINRINIEDSGSILCCMYYSYEWTADWEDLQITRYVVNKILLIYQPTDNTTGFSTTTTDKVQTIGSSTMTSVNSSSTTTTDKVQTIESSLMTSANSVKTSNSTVTIVSTLCGIAFTVLVLFVIWKRCYSTRSPESTRRLPTPMHEPFYLNMLFRKECDQQIAEIEAHTYEEIGP